MHSLSLLVASATLGLAVAYSPANDVVTVTSTRTHTFCPITTPVTCAAPTSSVAGDGKNGWGTGTKSVFIGSGQDPSIGDAYASLWDKAKTEYNGQWDDWNNVVPPTTSATTVGPSSTSAGPKPTTTGWYNGTTTSGSGVSSTTTSGYSTPTIIKNATDICNDNLHRSKWCDDKSISTDYSKSDYFTGVVRKYTFTITNTTLSFDGTGPKLALAINGQVPGPVIEANWGDFVDVTFINQLQDNATTIHFHGIRQVGTNDQDGVPGVTECAIAGNGGSRTYRWHASSYGTSWYHSHVFAQLADGIRGPIVIHGPASADYDYDLGTVMLDDT